MKIAGTDLGREPLLLAPMENVSDASFRYICKEYGADMMFTEFVSADGLIRDVYKSREKLVIADRERPIGIQIYGHIPEALLQAAVIAQEACPDVIDINFGCPKNKIAKRGAGSGWLRDPGGMVDITRRLVQAVKVPVTVKTRLGWDEESIIIEDLAEALQDAGIAALTIHGRTRTQMYKGEADWTPIARVRANPRMHIPIIGNGDICTPQQARYAFDTYGVDGIMIGRASFGHPWLFREIRHYLQTGQELPPMGVAERVSLAKRHLAKSIEVKGERVGVLEMRRHLNSYFKGLPEFKPVRLKLVTENDPQQLFFILDYIAEKWG
ncbi:MAG: tRNA dihydrouridine synthase DusB [Bacteroidales bacterium]|jgi:nifR3 family TIM-barrel protein|nr:tRNA dihydrouridine synthase DusB [Bacteroidales bacterium]MDD2264797.1 tRNA dihydrouridine synthase DusB [Bacteroidales bacterium]MDD2832105.1 tRNA dihydrouridine synthase DusB [Bacteroidales bacterium]MDD3208701.1 tRNA dihydrouridine synthase DusB [Bacteroidales bacterium]MDD3697264.1 tRNA dihydrouridine synthase DusB [Bacteroidales bacterium]